MMRNTFQAPASDPFSAGDEGIDTELWYACAGPYKTLPPVNSEVAYLPQGHIEQVASFNNQDIDGQIPRYNLPSVIPCALNEIQLSADPETDEVFATLTLCPLGEPVDDSSANAEPLVRPKRKSNSFTKTLTVSDTSTHGGFSVPRRAAEECLPPLDKSQDPPTQELVAKDLHGNEWKFRHIFRGQPKRHLLTTGWSFFVSQKRLVAGDAVVFLRGENGQLWIGVRRAPRQQQKSKVLTSPTMTLGVLAAAAHAASEKSRFSLIYNPRSCPSEFVIPIRKYLNAVKSTFTVGQRFKMRLESEDSADRRYTGTITDISDFDSARWPSSAWRSLQVNWDDSSPCERPERISPWEIGPFTGCTTVPPQVGTRKRLRPPAHSYRADHNLGTNRVGAGSPHYQTLGPATFVHGGYEKKGLPISLEEEADVDGEMPSQVSWNVKCEDGSEVEDDLRSRRLGADSWLQMRRPDLSQSNAVFRGVTGSGLQDCQGVMGIGRSKPEQHKFGVHQLYLENEDSDVDLGATLHLSNSGRSTCHSLVKPLPFGDADLQLCVSPTLTEQAGPRSTNRLWSQHSVPTLPYEETYGNGWMSSFRPQLEVKGPSALPSRPDCTVLSMGSLPPLDSWSSSYPSTPKFNFWENWGEPESDRNCTPAPPAGEQKHKIFGVPLDKPATVTISSQTSGSKVSGSQDDAANDTSNTCVEKIGSSVSSGNMIPASVPESELGGQRCKVIQSWQQAPVRSFTKVHKSGAIGRSIDVSKFDNYGELLEEVEEMFGFKGELFDKKSGWQLVYTDHEEDVLLVGDDPWLEFCSCVRSIRVLSPGEVSPAARSTGTQFVVKEKTNQSDNGKDTSKLANFQENSVQHSAV